MKPAFRRIVSLASALACAGAAAPLAAEEANRLAVDDGAEVAAAAVQERPAAPVPAPADVSRGTDGMPAPGTPSVFDGDWINVGVGVGLIPTYSGSDDYFLFPVPLATGRVKGIGFRPSGAGIVFDVLAPPTMGTPGDRTPQFSLGPAFRLRVERAVDSRDPVVEATGRLDRALEVGLAGGVTFPGVLHSADALSIGTQVRWDILGAHKGQVIEPAVSYLPPLSLGILVQLAATMEIVDDNFARYYQSVTPAQSAASGLPVFDAKGGLNRVGVNLTAAFDLDGNALNGGFNIFALAGYSRMVGDGARTPFTRLRGDPNQYLVGLGLGYTF